MSGQTYSPLIFEIHHDRADDKGRSGLIGSGLVADNPVYQSLQKDFGEYSPNYSASTHGGYGGPRSGMALIELGRSYKDWTPEMIETNTGRLWDSLMSMKALSRVNAPCTFLLDTVMLLPDKLELPANVK